MARGMNASEARRAAQRKFGNRTAVREAVYEMLTLGFGLLALLLVSGPARTFEAAPNRLLQTDVYVAGRDGYHTYRIPSVIVTPKGTLLAFAEARREGAEDAGDIDLVLKRSTDAGATWSAMQVIGDNGRNTFGNPCPVIDRTTGTIWLLTTQNLGEDSEQEIIDRTGKASRTVWVLNSTDDGRTWSAPAEITRSVKRSDWTWYATGPGVGIQTRSGRLVIPANHAVAGSAVHRSHVFFSDDHGATWQLGGHSIDGTNESQVVELADGRLMLNMRNHPRKRENFRAVALSGDEGETFAEPRYDRTLIEPPAQASLLRFSTATTEDRNRLLFANAASTTRERMTVRLSYDEGETWAVSRVVHAGPAAYSSLVVLPNLTIGLLYERGEERPYERLAFARFSLEWLTTGQDDGVGNTAAMKIPTGVLPAVVTPFDENGRFAPHPFERLLERLYGAGVHGVYLCGTTGEGLLQPPDERKRVTDVAVACTPPDRDVVVHVGAASMGEALELAAHASRAGARAISSLPPLAGGFHFTDVREYYRRLAAASTIPLIVYYFPASYPTITSVEQLEELCALPNVVGVKFTDFDLYTMARITQPDRCIFNGRDEVFAAGLLMGADGGIGSFYNLVPELFVRIHTLAREDRWPEARAVQREVNELITLTQPFPLFPAIKQVLTWLGIDCGPCLPPRRRLSDAERTTLRAALVDKGFWVHDRMMR
ncbi:MAG: hypothetical protein GEU99_07290 [Luteitalea sp.]|nr:hypothetical protein [Luteitalea sp.]